ncbi:8275_t:CDS:2, partial [Gigaspora rosea]
MKLRDELKRDADPSYGGYGSSYGGYGYSKYGYKRDADAEADPSYG